MLLANHWQFTRLAEEPHSATFFPHDLRERLANVIAVRNVFLGGQAAFREEKRPDLVRAQTPLLMKLTEYRTVHDGKHLSDFGTNPYEWSRATLVAPYVPLPGAINAVGSTDDDRAQFYRDHLNYKSWIRRKIIVSMATRPEACAKEARSFYEESPGDAEVDATLLRSLPAQYRSSFGPDSRIAHEWISADEWSENWVNAKFCIGTRCDDPSTHTFETAFQAGCIPVMVSDAFELSSWPSYMDLLGVKLSDVAMSSSTIYTS